ncbi:MAG: DUF167 domain-containing protein [Alphaproteobacteria bacterium]|nr:MAG: DUF167 domain-containing protein [Alphaproteobacteria bacterium]
MPLDPIATGVRLFVRATPSASKNEVQGLYESADGKRALRVRVTAAPEKGKANKAVVKLLAKSLRLPTSAFHLVSGETDRNKTFEVSGDPETLMRDIGAWIEEQST